MISKTIEIYKQSQVNKDEDFIWARYATRPFAAFFIVLFSPLKLTPNQWTLLSLLTGLASVACFAFYPGYQGLLIAWGLSQLAFTVDCMDGMVARAEKMYSPVGQKFDFLVDEIKALFLFPALGYRLFAENKSLSWIYGEYQAIHWLYLAAFSGALIATCLSMTNFMRSPEYTGQQKQQTRSYPKGIVGLLFRSLSFLLNYPSWILLPVLLDRMDLFLLTSIALYLAYSGYAGLKITLKIGRKSHYDRPSTE